MTNKGVVLEGVMPWSLICICHETFEEFVKRRFNCIAEHVKYSIVNCIHQYLFLFAVVLNMIKAHDFLKSLETLLYTLCKKWLGNKEFVYLFPLYKELYIIFLQLILTKYLTNPKITRLQVKERIFRLV